MYSSFSLKFPWFCLSFLVSSLQSLQLVFYPMHLVVWGFPHFFLVSLLLSWNSCLSNFSGDVIPLVEFQHSNIPVLFFGVCQPLVLFSVVGVDFLSSPYFFCSSSWLLYQSLCYLVEHFLSITSAILSSFLFISSLNSLTVCSILISVEQSFLCENLVVSS